MTAQLTCYGGVEEIGGNKLLLEEGERRWLFDFGRSFGRYGRYFDGVFIRERVGRGLVDLMALGLVPPLRGLLREDLIPAYDAAHIDVEVAPPAGRQRKPRPSVHLSPDAVERFWRFAERLSGYRDLRRPDAHAVDWILISHAHQDHIADIEYVDPTVPACSSRMAAFISKVLLDVGPPGSSGAPFQNPRAPSPTGMLQTQRDSGYEPRPWAFLEGAPEGEPGEDPLRDDSSFWASPTGSKGLARPPEYRSPDSRVRAWPVDHSLLGAVGYAVECEAGWVGYSGDLRFHGRHRDRSYAFADALAALEPVALICEGTRLGQPRGTSEAEVMDGCLEAVRAADGDLVVADFAPRNVERLLMFAEIAAETHRKLLLQPKDAYLLRAMALADPEVGEVMLRPEVGLYDDPKLKTQAWEETVRDRYASETITPDQVRRARAEFILALSLTDISDLLDLEFLLGGRPCGLYLFSNSPAYDDEQKVDLLRLWHWTRHLGMKLVGLRPELDDLGAVVNMRQEPGYHASGHAGSDDLIEFVRRVRPKTLIPVHTHSPGLWKGLLGAGPTRILFPQACVPLLIG